MENHFVVIGAPSSTGAYAPGQEKAPVAPREAGLLVLLQLNLQTAPSFLQSLLDTVRKVQLLL